MTFTSITFLLFLPLVYIAFRAVPDRVRWLVMLLASYAFYASFRSASLLVELALISIISYFGGRALAKPEWSGKRGAIFGSSVLLCLAILIAAKYLPHLPAIRQSGLMLGVMSIGLSYYTFQAIGYLIDIYQEVQEPEPHFGYFALYLAYFPKLLQGPLERAQDFLPQLRVPFRFDYENVRFGLLLFAEGLFLKVVIADRVARYVNGVYNNVHAYAGLSLLLATYGYAVQIYCDFAGYTNMARGTARLFNLDLSENFNHPYVSTSVAEFWRRWHMSFSRWILEYIFKPLQFGLRNWGIFATPVALLITFVAAGIWHGANWGFVIFGLLHGIYLASSTLFRPYQKKMYVALHIGKSAWYRALRTVITFHLVGFAWIFFRANTLSDALYVVRNIAASSGWRPAGGFRPFLESQILLGDKLHNVFAVTLMALVIFGGTREWLPRLQQRSLLIRWPAYLALSYIIVTFGIWESGSRFIYFAF